MKNEKFGDIILLNGKKALEKELDVKYYDGLPSTIEEEFINNVKTTNDILQQDTSTTSALEVQLVSENSVEIEE